MDETNDFNSINLPDSMEVDEFLIKMETEDEETSSQQSFPGDLYGNAPDDSSVEPEIVPQPMWEPKSEPVLNSTDQDPRLEVVQHTVPAPKLILKIEPDMVDNFVSEPETASVAPVNALSIHVSNEDFLSNDKDTMSLPGPSGSMRFQNTRIEPKGWRRILNSKIPTINLCDKPSDKPNKKGGGKQCCVAACGAYSDQCEGLTFYKLPFKMDRRLIWLKAIDRMDLVNQPLNFVCQRHFNKSDTITPGGSKIRHLRNTAVPLAYLLDKGKEHKGVQAIRIKFDNFSQTDYSNMETKAIQVTLGEPASFKNDEIKKLITECKKRLRSIENGAHKTQLDAFNNWCNRFLPGQLAEIIKAQATLKFNHSGNRYDISSKALSLNLFYTSKQAYDLLCKDLCLPHSASLKRIDIPVSTEYNEDIMTALKIKVDNMSEREKYCSVIVDFMKLKASLGYLTKKDRISGLLDINGCQFMEPAQYALVIFARGLFVNWSQPIAFALLSETKRHLQISEWIDKYLKKLLDIGLKIKTFIPTFKSDLLNEAQQRSISVDKPYFYVNDIKIYYVFDVPDMLKELRDTFLHYRFHFRKRNTVAIAEVKHVIDLLQQDLKKKLRLAPKLTLKHLYPKTSVENKVLYAAQLLSRSVATALEMRIDFEKVDDESGKDTVYFLLLMNNLFDTLNSSSVKGQQYKKAYSGDKIQVDLLQESLEFFQTLQFTGKGEQTCNRKFTEGFQITIKSVLLLFEDLKAEGHEHLFTRHLHLELSKKFFKTIKKKSGMVVVPTSKHFVGIFRDLYLNSILKPPKQRNCSRDLAKFLIELNETEDKLLDKDSVSNQKEVLLANSPQSILQSVSDATAIFTELKVAEENNVGDICKILLKGCLKHHKNCDGFKVFVDSFNGAYGVNDKNDWAMQTLETISPVYFVCFIENMEKEFCAAFEALETNNNVGLAAYERINNLEFAPPCSCFPTNYFKALFIRLRIHIVVNYNTDVYRKHNFIGGNVVIPKITSIYA